jgi:predicted nucleic acid-binding protein
MILVDTSVWVDHLRRRDAALAIELGAGTVLVHPFVVGEIACGRWPGRAETLSLLAELPPAVVATHGETLVFIERHDLAGAGIGYLDMHLLASTALTPGARLWTRDKRLAAAAAALRLAHSSTGG